VTYYKKTSLFVLFVFPCVVLAEVLLDTVIAVHDFQISGYQLHPQTVQVREKEFPRPSVPD